MTIHILFLAAEAEPFIKIGGLGDVAGALPDAIKATSARRSGSEQVDIRVVLPFHFAIKQRGFKPKFLGEFDVHHTNGSTKCQVFLDEKDGIPVYLLDGEYIDEKSPVYSSDPIYDGYKYVFFSLASLELAEFLNWRVDILHGNDWHTATAIYTLRTTGFCSEMLASAKTIHTLHNLPFMGFGAQQALTYFGLPPTEDSSLPQWARQMPLPMGLLRADKIVAVSPHYAEEILTPEFGCGLQDFLKTRRSALTGIVNGLDVEKWNPETDPMIAQTFSADNLSERIANKLDLQRYFKFQQDQNVPLLTLISRMDPQKGIDIALRGLKYIEDLPWQAIILGTGIPMIEEMAQHLEAEYPDRVRSVIGFDNQLAHRLYAGADMFLMPSRYEPCGLSQMIAMRYGCVPIARATGGLVDTIKHISYAINRGTGFLFNQTYPSVLARTLRRAFQFYQVPEQWRQIQLNGMRLDFSWEKSAAEYINVYRSLIYDQ